MLYPEIMPAENELLDNAYQLGQAAALDGNEDNPYRKGCREWQEWWLGYDTKEEL